MKKKFLSLLTLLCLAVTGAWAGEDIVIFSMTNVTGPTTSITHQSDPTTVEATFNTGSSAEVYNGHSSNDAIMCNGYINLAGSGNSYFHATFSTALAEGDIITCTNTTGTFKIGISNSSYSSVTFPYTIPANSTFIGETNIYVKKEGANNFSSFTITRPNGTHAPSINLNTNEVTLACSTDGATIYYTLDGSIPTSSSTLYSGVFTLDNSCTIRAIAVKDEDASNITEKECYIDHSSEALAVLYYSGGSLDGDSKVWTSSDEKYTLTISTNTFSYVTLNNTNDGFKLNHVDSYTLETPSNVKISKIKVVGKTWAEGYTATLTVDDFTTEDNSFVPYPSGGKNYLKTLEFTPSSSLPYGAPIVLRPAGAQNGAYIEIYGTETTEPSIPVGKETVTHTVTFDADGAVCSNAEIVTMSGGGIKNPTYSGYTKAMEMSSNASITIKLPTGASNASVTLFGTNGSTKLKLNSDSKTDITWTGDATNGYTTTIEIDDSNAGKIYTISKGDGASQIHKITLTYIIGSDDKITLTTTANMAGWRAFYDGSQAYTVDANTKVYVARSKGENSVTLAEIGDAIPSNTPVILKTSADNYTMTLTKTTLDNAEVGDNLLAVTEAGDVLTNVYRLGYGADGVGFYQYSTNSAAAGIIYINAGSGSRMLAINFDESGTTNVNDVRSKMSDVRGEYYDLQGRKVANPTKGLYIVNGRKVAIK